MLKEKRYFVSGIDTDAGKSYATGWLAAALNATGRRVTTQKLIQTGCAPQAVSEDIATHRRLMGMALQPYDLDHTSCPLRFGYPASPHLAAAMEGREIDLSAADRATAALLALGHDTVLIEGAGGLMVPIFTAEAATPPADDFYMIDYARTRDLPLILVTGARLGSLNHTLLSLEACRTRGVRVAAVLYNLWGATSAEITADTRAYLARYLAKFHPDCDFFDVPVL